MRYLKIAAFLLIAFSTFNAAAQKTNAEKIVGCWVFKKMEFNAEYDFSEQLIKQTLNTVVCFDTNGKFTSAKTGSTPVKGSYNISADGKTLSQKRDFSEDGSVDEDASIELLDDKHLQFKLDFGIMHFERK